MGNSYSLETYSPENEIVKYLLKNNMDPFMQDPQYFVNKLSHSNRIWLYKYLLNEGLVNPPPPYEEETLPSYTI